MSNLNKNNRRIGSFGPLLFGLLDEVGNQEEKRTGMIPSYYVMGEILAKRVREVGLKKQ